MVKYGDNNINTGMNFDTYDSVTLNEGTDIYSI